MWCKYHQADHDIELVKQFEEQCQRLKIPLEDDCPIKTIMENPTRLDVLEPSYLLLNEECTSVSWPENIDMFFTRLPSTEKEGYAKGLVGYIANRAYFNMNNNSLAFVLISSLKEEKQRPFSIIDSFTTAGFNFIDTIVWVKNKFIPTQGSKRLNNVYDFVFMFSKGENYHLDRESISHLKNRLDAEETNQYLCGGNVWKIKINDNESVPVELVDSVIKLSNILPNSLIADPFMADGATLQAAMNGMHSFWGCEKDLQKYSKCKKIIKKHRAILDIKRG